MIWMELLAVGLGIAGGWCGARLLRRVRLWTLAAAACGAILILTFLGHRSVRLSFMPPIAWLIDPRVCPGVEAFALTMLLTLVISRLPARRTRLMAASMAALLAAYVALWPLALALAVRGELSGLKSHIDANGVCWQTKPYTCGPASAVTCLRMLGVKAEEGTLAIASECRPPDGIQGPMLAAAISRLHASDGVIARYQWCDSLRDLRLPAVACMQIGAGHDVAVLSVTDDAVLVGDPGAGMRAMPRAAFEAAWTHAAITISRHDAD